MFSARIAGRIVVVNSIETAASCGQGGRVEREAGRQGENEKREGERKRGRESLLTQLSQRAGRVARVYSQNRVANQGG